MFRHYFKYLLFTWLLGACLPSAAQVITLNYSANVANNPLTLHVPQTLAIAYCDRTVNQIPGHCFNVPFANGDGANNVWVKRIQWEVNDDKGFRNFPATQNHELDEQQRSVKKTYFNYDLYDQEYNIFNPTYAKLDNRKDKENLSDNPGGLSGKSAHRSRVEETQYNYIYGVYDSLNGVLRIEARRHTFGPFIEYDGDGNATVLPERPRELRASIGPEHFQGLVAIEGYLNEAVNNAGIAGVNPFVRAFGERQQADLFYNINLAAAFATVSKARHLIGAETSYLVSIVPRLDTRKIHINNRAVGSDTTRSSGFVGYQSDVILDFDWFVGVDPVRGGQRLSNGFYTAFCANELDRNNYEANPCPAHETVISDVFIPLNYNGGVFEVIRNHIPKPVALTIDISHPFQVDALPRFKIIYSAMKRYTSTVGVTFLPNLSPYSNLPPYNNIKFYTSSRWGKNIERSIGDHGFFIMARNLNNFIPSGRNHISYTGLRNILGGRQIGSGALYSNKGDEPPNYPDLLGADADNIAMRPIGRKLFEIMQEERVDDFELKPISDFSREDRRANLGRLKSLWKYAHTNYQQHAYGNTEYSNNNVLKVVNNLARSRLSTRLYPLHINKKPSTYKGDLEENRRKQHDKVNPDYNRLDVAIHRIFLGNVITLFDAANIPIFRATKVGEMVRIVPSAGGDGELITFEEFVRMLQRFRAKWS